MANGGNAHDRRRLRRLVQSILETYGLLPPGAALKRQSLWDFLFKYILAALSLAGFGHWMAEYGVLAASFAYLAALGILFRGVWVWCNTRRRVVALILVAATTLSMFAWRDYEWIRREWTPTFLYVVPSRELMDCERRAFFIDHSGFKDLGSAEILIKDNRSGAVEVADYRSSIALRAKDTDPAHYFWLTPSHPWDEAYTVTVTGPSFRSVQEIVFRSVKSDVQLAMRVTLSSRKDPVLSCRDQLLPDSYPLAVGSKHDCKNLMAVDATLLKELEPEPYGFQQPNGDYSIVRIRKLPPASDLESQSEDRHLTEYQQSVMRSKLSRYRGSKIRILYTGGAKSLAYARAICEFFKTIVWQCDGPSQVPSGDERLVDIQVSVSKRHWNAPDPRASDLLSSLEGLKHRQAFVYDEQIPPDVIVLWVGPKSPDNFKPDDCAAASLDPTPGQPHTCEMVRQVPSFCPFPSQ